MKFYISKLGCPKNDVDADYITARLLSDGHQLVAEPALADSILVNTCGFIQAAKEESINELLRLSQYKRESPSVTLFATGCLSQRYGDELLAEMPELDGAFGHGALESVAQAVAGAKQPRKAVRIESRKLGYLSWKNRFIADSLPYSYLKISDGCDRLCTYCAIPGMRGKFRSRPMKSILTEAEYLAKNGKKELILVSQEATLYGYELPGKPSIVALLRALEQIEGIQWIRLMYQYPAAMTDELIEYLASGSKTLNYFDLPLQHASTSVLERMNRRATTGSLEKVIATIRSSSSNSTLRTTFIVGFPGETEEEFAQLRDFVVKHRFDRMGVFPYSAEEGTPAALMAGQIDDDVKQQRMDELLNLQREIALENNERLIGSLQMVMIDAIEPDGTRRGRTKADCPDIDQEVVVVGNAAIGEICPVRIEALDGYDLAGTVSDREQLATRVG